MLLNRNFVLQSQLIGYVFTITSNSMALSRQANYTDRATADCRQNLVLTFVDRGASCGQGGGSPRPTITNSKLNSKLLHERYQCYINVTNMCGESNISDIQCELKHTSMRNNWEVTVTNMTTNKKNPWLLVGKRNKPTDRLPWQAK
jgi:hypothetical protein